MEAVLHVLNHAPLAVGPRINRWPVNLAAIIIRQNLYLLIGKCARAGVTSTSTPCT
jgi:hypothetical protein